MLTLVEAVCDELRGFRRLLYWLLAASMLGSGVASQLPRLLPDAPAAPAAIVAPRVEP